MVKVVIIDDEKSSRETIKFLLADYFPEVTVSAEAESVDDAVKIIEEQNPELVFLDIEIKGGTGLHVLQRLKKRDFKLIFITAFNDFAIKAIKFSAIDYILKPINEFEFKNCDCLIERKWRALKWHILHPKIKKSGKKIIMIF